MKKYVCVNFLQCDYADEKPPREFELADVLNNVCPECGSTNIREVALPPSPLKKIIPFVLGGLFLLGVVAYMLLQGDNKKVTPVPPVLPVESATVVSGPSSNTANNGPELPHRTDDPIPPKPTPITYKKVEGSEFCVGDCILAYSEIDNLGRIKERRIENYDKCCPAEN